MDNDEFRRRMRALQAWHRRLRRMVGYAAALAFAASVTAVVRALVTGTDYFDAPTALIAVNVFALTATVVPLLIDRVEIQPRITSLAFSLPTASTAADGVNRQQLVLLRWHQRLMRLLCVGLAYLVALPFLLRWAERDRVLDRDWVDSDGALLLFFCGAFVIVVLFAIDVAVVRRLDPRTVRASIDIDR